MSPALQELTRMIEALPRAQQIEVKDFVEFLLTRTPARAPRRLRQSWAGALREYRDQYSPQELQQKALDWRAEECI